MSNESYRFDDEDDILDILDELGYDSSDPAAKKNERIKRIMEEFFPCEDKECKTCRKCKCECGAEKVGSSIHSSWCPKYKKED
jgi:hypothetical protein